MKLFVEEVQAVEQLIALLAKRTELSRDYTTFCDAVLKGKELLDCPNPIAAYIDRDNLLQ